MKNDTAENATIVVGCLFIIAAVALISALIAALFQLAWNFVVPAIFPSLPPITFWQAYALWFLLGIIGSRFKSSTSSSSSSKS